MLPSFNISYRTLKSVEKWVKYNIITQVYNFYWKFPRFHKYLITFSDVSQYLCSWAHFEGKFYLYTSIERNRSWPVHMDRSFPVFNSQKSKDWTRKNDQTMVQSSPVVVPEPDFQTLGRNDSSGIIPVVSSSAFAHKSSWKAWRRAIPMGRITFVMQILSGMALFVV